ncbi:Acg family FMN-binding oxidoreductase [Spirillospora albida]|uniref:Acg family FMN-binding oxidoreductase n=1 Tax=Spirillospora albida TaxID=58123 RepID=UPI0004BF0DC1|nr:hypothetical protein [Spirillospora albida]
MKATTTGTAPATDIRRAVEDAIWAPSVHNTQPWRFGVRGARIALCADGDRRLDASDPDGREMLISCGAALLNLRIALHARGHDTTVRILPDPDRPHLLADVEATPGALADDDALFLHAQIRRRRSHRGGFQAAPVPPGLLAAFRDDAGRDGARLIQAVDANVQGALAALTNAAEHSRRRSPAHTAETARWAPAPGTRRTDGVQQGAYPRETPRTAPHFASRDFARGHGWGLAAAPAEAAPGAVLLLVTPADGPAHWLRTGQALQRVLLRAAGHGLAAAYHSQALLVPELRAFIRTTFCGNAYPQLLLRLGVPDGEPLQSVRRPVEEVLFDDR